jgi:Putative phage tail protein
VQFGERLHTEMGATGFQADLADDGALWISTDYGHAVALGTEDIALDFDSAVPQVQRWDPITRELVLYDEPAYPISGKGAAFGTSYFVGSGLPGNNIGTPVNVCTSPAVGYAIAADPYHHGLSIDAYGNTFSHQDYVSSAQFQNIMYWPSVPGFLDNSVYWFSGNGLVSSLGLRFSLAGSQVPYAGEFAAPCSAPYPYVKPTLTAEYKNAPDWSFKSTTVNGASWVQGYGGTFSGDNWLYDMAGDNVYYFPGSSVTMPPFVYDQARGSFFVWAGDDQRNLYIDGVDSGYELPNTDAGLAYRVNAFAVDTATGHLRLIAGTSTAGGTVKMIVFNPDALEIVEETVLSGVTIGTGASGRAWDFPDQLALLYVDGVRVYWIPYGISLDDSPVLLSEIVTDLSLAVGLTADQIDVTELTDEVLGFLIARQGSARAAIEQLMVAYSFDAVQSGAKVKFVKRGKAPCATIGMDDLAAHESGSDVPEPLPLTRADDVALPKSVVIKYVNREADYLIGAQSARRQTGRAQTETVVDLPIVLPDAHAKAVADQALFSGWVARTKTSWATTLEYLRLEPTDVVTIEGDDIYITKRTLNGGVIEFEGEFDAGLVIIGGAVAGASIAPPTVSLSPAPLTNMELIDTALLRDGDDHPGAYLALWPQAVGWKGAKLYSRVFLGDWSVTAEQGTPGSAAGIATTALADWAGGWVVDRTSRVTVRMENGALYSVTDEQLLAGANLVAIGADGRWEVVGYRDAELNDDGTYTLSTLLRGRHGTEWALGTHLAGDRVVFIKASTVSDYDIRAVDIGVPFEYRPVSNGRTLESTWSRAYALEAERLKPLAPVNLHCTRDVATGDATILWDRRSRLSARPLNVVQPPLGEATEAYELEVWNEDFDVLYRTVTGLTSPEFEYTAAMQTTDFGSTQDTVHVRVYQLSATVGRGRKLEGSV